MKMQDLSQKDFSDFIKNGLLKDFPYFSDYIKTKDDILTIEYPSQQKTATFWITTQDLEITIGFDNSEGNCSWHTHMSLFGAYEPVDELKTSIELIKNIFNGIEILVFESDSIIYLTKNPDEEIANAENNQILEFKKWTEI
ncbi:hypothetical protein ADICYQ_5848 [Cyclobacterium qasimii M12-11B]|uniref:Uncharacterized protein n=2 Tax=Cyclobacterium qasimii TaxID=1350429 RepID=S7V5B9_9BACT|nr:hypothetical protein ADICYQ_5848 [Cyclobacterium qasimii M12-11B]